MILKFSEIIIQLHHAELKKKIIIIISIFELFPVHMVFVDTAVVDPVYCRLVYTRVGFSFTHISTITL